MTVSKLKTSAFIFLIVLTIFNPSVDAENSNIQYYLEFIYELGNAEIFIGEVLIATGTRNINNLEPKDIELIKKADTLLEKCLSDLDTTEPPDRFKKLHFLYKEMFTLQKEGMKNLLVALDKSIQIDQRQQHLVRYFELFEYAEEKMTAAQKLMDSLNIIEDGNESR